MAGADAMVDRLQEVLGQARRQVDIGSQGQVHDTILQTLASLTQRLTSIEAEYHRALLQRRPEAVARINTPHSLPQSRGTEEPQGVLPVPVSSLRRFPTNISQVAGGTGRLQWIVTGDLPRPNRAEALRVLYRSSLLCTKDVLLQEFELAVWRAVTHERNTRAQGGTHVSQNLTEEATLTIRSEFQRSGIQLWELRTVLFQRQPVSTRMPQIVWEPQEQALRTSHASQAEDTGRGVRRGCEAREEGETARTIEIRDIWVSLVRRLYIELEAFFTPTPCTAAREEYRRDALLTRQVARSMPSQAQPPVGGVGATRQRGGQMQVPESNHRPALFTSASCVLQETQGAPVQSSLRTTVEDEGECNDNMENRPLSMFQGRRMPLGSSVQGGEGSGALLPSESRGTRPGGREEVPAQAPLAYAQNVVGWTRRDVQGPGHVQEHRGGSEAVCEESVVGQRLTASITPQLQGVPEAQEPLPSESIQAQDSDSQHNRAATLHNDVHRRDNSQITEAGLAETHPQNEGPREAHPEVVECRGICAQAPLEAHTRDSSARISVVGPPVTMERGTGDAGGEAQVNLPSENGSTGERLQDASTAVLEDAWASLEPGQTVDDTVS